MQGKTEQRRHWSVVDTIAILVITAIGGILRLVRLDRPAEMAFDEVYYAKDSCWYAYASKSICDVDGPPNEVHPPLGKWLISAGIRAFDFDSFGWRIAAVVAGTITIALLYLLAKKILRSTVAAALSSGLLVFDPLHFVQSRISMVDIFVPMFGLAAFLFIVHDRERIPERVAHSPPTLARPWRAAAGLAAGAAVASKWSGGLLLVAVLALTVAWEIAARREEGSPQPLRRFLRSEGPSILLYLGIVPLAVYLFTYIGRLDGTILAAPWTDGAWLSSLWDHHRYMFDFHKDLEATHSYQSPPWSWPLLKRPVSYSFCSGADCDPPAADNIYREVFATGNPFVWWAAIIAVGFVAVAWARRRDWRRAEGVILAGVAFSYLPWFVLATDRSAVFLFYMLPTVPFICLALGYVVTRIGQSWEAKASIALFSAGAIGLFGFYYPLLADKALPRDQWENRIWIFDNCDKPPGKKITTTITETQEGTTTVRTEETTSDDSLPPTGWCWI
jgi:dolichyl-phosphate-mannose-protein mannosyltransferase